MSLSLKILAALAGVVLLPSLAGAQGVVLEKQLSLATARVMADTVVEVCRKNGFRVAVTIVDRGGQIKVFHRDDGANPHTQDASFKKAYTARTYRIPSAEFMKRTLTERQGLRQIENILAVGGGLPIMIGNETIAGIGVAGAPGPKGDEYCAAQAIERVRDQLK
jgi:uncharacterized protein GlcG (DUF336 family)